MKYLAVFLAWIISTEAEPDSPQRALQIGKQWYDRRAEGAQGLLADPEVIDQAIASFEQAMKNESLEEEVGILLLKCFFFKGEYALSSKKDKREAFLRGKNLGERLMLKYPRSAGIRYFYVTNIGSWAKTVNILKAARQGVADVIRDNAKEIIKIDPNYDNGGGYFLLGMVHLEAPKIPFILPWPSKKVAVANLRRSVTMDPASVYPRVMLAKALIETRRKEEAIAILEELVQRKPRPDRLVEDSMDLEEAAQLLEKTK